MVTEHQCGSCAELRDRVSAMEVHVANSKEAMTAALGAIERLTGKIEALTSVMDRKSGFETAARWFGHGLYLAIGLSLGIWNGKLH